MRLATIVLLALALVAAPAAAEPTLGSPEHFVAWKQQTGKQYASVAEEATRFQVFAANMEKAKKLQAVNPHAKFGANKFADMTEAEFKVYHSANAYFSKEAEREKNVELHSASSVKAATGTSVDWRQKGAVTSVKNQGQCGSCWSFSAAQNIEGQWFLAGHTLVSLAEQELVSCDHTDNGCNGGLMPNAWKWLINNRNGTITSYADYPYVSGTGYVPACKAEIPPAAAQITGFKDIAHDENQMAAQVLAGGPLSIAVDATSWQTYTGGIMTNCQATQVDHGVLIVGYDDTNQPPYWIIKNSWAASWGEEGYIRVEKGKNECLITTLPCTSIAAKGPLPPPAPTPKPTPAPPTPVPTPSPPYTGGWRDLFSPPYANAPSIMMAIGCTAEDACYVPAGSNNQGFDVMRFNGQVNGTFTKLTMEGTRPVMMMGMGVGKNATTGAPQGAVAGMGIGGGAVSYFKSKSELADSDTNEFIVVSQDVRASKSGKNVLVVDSSGSNMILSSSNAGAEFTPYKITSPIPQPKCTSARYGAIADEQGTMFVTLGGWPSNNNAVAPSDKTPVGIQMSERVRLEHAATTKSGFRRVSAVPRAGRLAPLQAGAVNNANNNNTCADYTTAIAKTTDGGKSWKTVFSAVTDFYLNAIDCVSATHCVTVGEGFNAKAGGRIMLTTDGENFREVFSEPSSSSGMYSFMSVNFMNDKEVWVAGSKMVSQIQSTGVFFHSVDGGASWTEYSHGLANLGEVMAMSAVPGKSMMFAVGTTIFDDSTILQYESSV